MYIKPLLRTCNRLIFLVLFVSLVGSVSAENVRWTGNDPAKHLWSNPGNWLVEESALNRVAAVDDTVWIDGTSTAEIDSSMTGVNGAVCNQLYGPAYMHGPAVLDITGGQLTVKVNMEMSYQPGGVGTVNMSGGALNIGGELWVGHQGNGTINMTNGVVTVGGRMSIPKQSIGKGHVQLDGGIIYANDFHIRENDGMGTMDITAGTLILTGGGDFTGAIKEYIQKGWLTAYGGSGTVLVDHSVTNAGSTTITAIPVNLNIDVGNDAEVQAAIDRLLVNYSGHKGIAMAICFIADKYSELERYEKADQLYQKIIDRWPNTKYAAWAQMHLVMSDIQRGEVSAAQTAIDRLLADFAEDERLVYVIRQRMAEAYYIKGVKSSQSNPEPENVFFRKSVAISEDNALRDFPDKPTRASVYYMIGLNYWQVGEYFDAGDAFSASIEADPNHKFAGNMHWLIADCYEKLKAAGDVNAPEADAIIEWGYQTLFDNYPDCSIIDYAAVRLSQINMERGRQTAACAYYCWLVMSADGDGGRIDFINNMFKQCGRCNNE